MEGRAAFPVQHFNFLGQLIVLIHTMRLLGGGAVVAPGDRECLADLDEGGEEVMK